MKKLNAERLGRLLKEHPRPLLDRGPDEDHVSDPFVFDGEELFFHYVGGAIVWIIRPTLDPDQRDPLFEGVGEEAEIENALRFMPPPPPPTEAMPLLPQEDVSGAIFQGPIWYRGRPFTWIFTEAEGWRLAHVANYHADAAASGAPSALHA